MGSRILNYVLLFLAGLVLGVLGSIAQQTMLTIGRLQLPSGLIIALVALACLLVGVRLLGDSRWPAFAVALGAVIPAAVFAVPSFGGSVIIPGNAAGYAWVYSPVVLAILVVGWPNLRAHRPGAQAPASGAGGAEARASDTSGTETGTDRTS